MSSATGRIHIGWIIGAGIIGLGIAGYLVFVFSASASVQRELAKTYSVLTQSDFSCPKGTQIHIERWGEVGWARFCDHNGEKHGPWQAWKHQRVVIEGGFFRDQKDGVWNFLEANGGVYRVIEYERGQEVSNTVMPE